MSKSVAAGEHHGAHDKLLFWGCFVALIATAFGFVLRTMVIGEWATEFNLTQTQQGEIFGVGLWPFAISIVLFSLIIDKIGYGVAMGFAFVCHVLSAVLTIAAPYIAANSDDPSATGYWVLYVGTFIVALGNGTVEAVVNPVVATMFAKDKAKWLNMLHAGWPGGLVIGGILAIFLGDIHWQYKIALILLPTVAYGVMMLGRHFPVSERVTAGVSFKDMLSEAGAIGALIVSFLITRELGRVFGFGLTAQIILVVLIVVSYGLYVRSLGRPLFIFLLLIMIPLATTELGTDSWITPLMDKQMHELGLSPVWVLVYTSFIMMMLRFNAGPIIHRFSPLGLLAICAVIAAVGLFSLSFAAGFMILIAATIYGVGKSFFWPTMLGVVAEQFPRGGALTLNTIAGVGMLSVGILGAPLLGAVQDKSIENQLTAHDAQQSTQLHDTYVTLDKVGIFGEYLALDKDALKTAPEADVAVISAVENEAGRVTLRTVATFPVLMLVCYLILIAYFRSKGGYRPVELEYGGLGQEGAVEK